ncbi:hypothetical protein HNP98_001507 [Hymenobacter sp. 9A]|uniref:DUF4338 domain-containing protein n=1 Tax=Hymenobacter caeli TaxID=2735894 RepID=A0ABX2FNV5_9BACT|nr:hypothetical protein [Hymenobacter caeli]
MHDEPGRWPAHGQGVAQRFADQVSRTRPSPRPCANSGRASQPGRARRPGTAGRCCCPPTHTRFGAVEAGWPSKRLGAARTAGSESAVRGTNERGCWARRQWAWGTRRRRQRPTAWPWGYFDAPLARAVLAVMGKRFTHGYLLGRHAQRHLLAAARGAVGRRGHTHSTWQSWHTGGPLGDMLVGAHRVGWPEAA